MRFVAPAADPPFDSSRPSKIPQSPERSSNAWASPPAHLHSNALRQTTDRTRLTKMRPGSSIRPRRTTSRSTHPSHHRSTPPGPSLDTQHVPNGSLAPAVRREPSRGSRCCFASRQKRPVAPAHVEIVLARGLGAVVTQRRLLGRGSETHAKLPIDSKGGAEPELPMLFAELHGEHQHRSR